MVVRVGSSKEGSVEMEDAKGGPGLVGESDLVWERGFDDVRKDERIVGTVSWCWKGEGCWSKLSEDRAEQAWTMSVDEGLFNEDG